VVEEVIAVPAHLEASVGRLQMLQVGVMQCVTGDLVPGREERAQIGPRHVAAEDCHANASGEDAVRSIAGSTVEKDSTLSR
jgi:hypothetical protein